MANPFSPKMFYIDVAGVVQGNPFGGAGPANNAVDLALSPAGVIATSLRYLGHQKISPQGSFGNNCIGAHVPIALTLDEQVREVTRSHLLFPGDSIIFDEPRPFDRVSVGWTREPFDYPYGFANTNGGATSALEALQKLLNVYGVGSSLNYGATRHWFLAFNGNDKQVYYERAGAAVAGFLESYSLLNAVAISGSSTTAGVNEEQRLIIDATGGTFTVTFGADTTGALAWNITANNLTIALEGLVSIGAGNVVVTGGPGDAGGTTPYIIEFQGDLSTRNVAMITADGALLTGGAGTATPSLLTAGSAADSTTYHPIGHDKECATITLALTATNGTSTITIEGFNSYSLTDPTPIYQGVVANGSPTLRQYVIGLGALAHAFQTGLNTTPIGRRPTKILKITVSTEYQEATYDLQVHANGER